ncbi:MAG: hypothetical protein QM757_21480 [Paludibaculum sp.]
MGEQLAGGGLQVPRPAAAGHGGGGQTTPDRATTAEKIGPTTAHHWGSAGLATAGFAWADPLGSGGRLQPGQTAGAKPTPASGPLDHVTASPSPPAVTSRRSPGHLYARSQRIRVQWHLE